MDYKAIQELMDTMNKSQLYSLEIQSGDMTIKMKKGPDNVVIDKPNVSESIPLDKAQKVNYVAEKPETEDEKEKDKSENEDDYTVKSPIVGTFYESSSPDAEPFAKVGSKVKKGDVLCIIEAMKLMNEIESDVSGEVTEVLVENQQMVEYGQPLFKIKIS